jgi:hypothetical protein
MGGGNSRGSFPAVCSRSMRMTANASKFPFRFLFQSHLLVVLFFIPACLRHVDAPLQHVDAPLQHVDAPLQHVDAPLQHVDAFLQHVDAPLQHVDAPLQHVDAPLQLRKNKALVSLYWRVTFLPLATACDMCVHSGKV